jgi:hypothetical protein
MPILNLSVFWLLVFIIQLFLLSLISNKLFSRIYLFLHRFFKKDSTVVFVVSLVFLPGTFIHELCHAMAATFLGSRVTAFSIWPKVEGDTIKMGYAEVEVLDIFRNSLIGTAPLIFGTIILYFLSSTFQNADLVFKIIYLYFIFQISNSMFLSPADLKEVRVLFFLGLFVLITAYVTNFYFYKINFLPQNFNFLYSDYYLSTLKTINFFLSFPLVFNFILLLLARYFITHKRY